MTIPTQLQPRLIGLALLLLIVIGIIIFVLSSAFSPKNQPLNGVETRATPTPIPDSSTSVDPITYQFTPLQKTTVAQTTEEQISQQNEVISKTTAGDVTIYTVSSKEPGKNDEIRTKNGIVVFERTSTRTNAAPLPKTATIRSQFGDPEETLDNIGDGFYMSAYLYPTKGFAIYANNSTGSVYEIQRFLPMTLTDYKTQYGEKLAPAPAMPKEFQGL